MTDRVCAQMRRLVELSTDVLAVLDEEGRVVRVNPASERALGVAPPALAERRLAELLQPGDADRVLACFEALREPGACAAVTCRTVGAEGEERVLECLVQRGPDDGLLYLVAHDATARLAADAEARAAIRRLEEAQRVARLGSYEFDLLTGERFYTEQLYRLYDLDPAGEEPLSPETFLERVLPEDRGAVQRAMGLAARSGAPVGTDFRMAHAPDRILHGLVQVEVDEHGTPVRARGTTQDVTQIRAEETRRRAGERRLAEAERLAGLGSFEWRAHDGHVAWSDGMYRLFGLPPGARPIGAREFYDRMRPEEAQAAREAIRRAAESLAGWEIEFHMHDAHGVERAMAGRGEAFLAGGELHVRGTVQDVTRERRAVGQQQEIARLAHEALAGTTTAELLQDACATIARVVTADAITVLERRGGELALAAHAGWSDGPPEVVLEPGLQSVHRDALDRGRMVAVEDWRLEEHYAYPPLLEREGIRATVVVPIRAAADPFGVLTVHRRGPELPEADQLAFLEALAALLATAIARGRDEEEIAALAAQRARLVAERLEVEERTRRRISEALHEGALQDLLAVRQDLVEAAHGSGDREEMLEYARGGVERAAQRIREAVQALEPPAE